MQNKGNNCTRCTSGDTEFIALDGSWGSAAWNCGSCGCANCGCDSCSRCGWSRCGNGCGAVVSVNAPRKRSGDGCEERAARQNEGCAREHEHLACECAEAVSTSCRQYAECCDKNVYIRDLSDGCGKTNAHTHTDACGKNSSNAACAQNQRRCAECSSCGNDAAYDAARTDCDCCGRERAVPCAGRNKGVGMVRAAVQELDQIFESDSALRSGTLFPELHKPMNGYCPDSCNCQTDEQAAAFAAWELRLYLNTHPCDKQALALFRKLCREADDPNYATSFLEDADCDAGWSWTDDPWPWECRSCDK